MHNSCKCLNTRTLYHILQHYNFHSNLILICWRAATVWENNLAVHSVGGTGKRWRPSARFRINASRLRHQQNYECPKDLRCASVDAWLMHPSCHRTCAPSILLFFGSSILTRLWKVFFWSGDANKKKTSLKLIHYSHYYRRGNERASAKSVYPMLANLRHSIRVCHTRIADILTDSVVESNDAKFEWNMQMICAHNHLSVAVICWRFVKYVYPAWRARFSNEMV